MSCPKPRQDTPMNTDIATIDELEQLLHRLATRSTIRLHYQITDHAFISTRHPHVDDIGTY